MHIDITKTNEEIIIQFDEALSGLNSDFPETRYPTIRPYMEKEVRRIRELFAIGKRAEANWACHVLTHTLNDMFERGEY